MEAFVQAPKDLGSALIRGEATEGSSVVHFDVELVMPGYRGALRVSHMEGVGEPESNHRARCYGMPARPGEGVLASQDRWSSMGSNSVWEESGIGLGYVHHDMPTVQRLEREAFSEEELRDLTSWLEAAYADPAGSWRDEMWAELGPGPHFLIEEDGDLVAHACLVFGQVRVGGLKLETAFVENVATRADRRREGFATAVMRAAQAEILNEADLGVLSTGTPAFYEPLGWERWLGPTSVREADGTTTLTPEEDGFVHVLRTQKTPVDLDLTAPIQRDRRDADEPW